MARENSEVQPLEDPAYLTEEDAVDPANRAHQGRAFCGSMVAEKGFLPVPEEGTAKRRLELTLQRYAYLKGS